MRRAFFFAALVLLSGCGRKPDAGTFVMMIESSPTNLDPRIGVDGQSERIDDLIFDDLRAEHADPAIERADVGAVREPGGAPLVFPRAGAAHDSRVNLSCTAL